MTRYSREEIEKLLNEGTLHLKEGRVIPFAIAPGGSDFNNKSFKFIDASPKIISQLLEENRILREGLMDYADSNCWQSALIQGIRTSFSNHLICFGNDDVHGFEPARETLTAADEVGREKE